MIPSRIWQLAFAGCLLAITWLSLAPQSQLPPVNIWDKLSHVIADLALGLLLHLGWPLKERLKFSFLSLFIYGAAIEFIQSFLPFREGSMADIVANTLGLLAAIVVAQGLNYLQKTRVPG